MSEPLRLMSVHAHPDDESSKGAATVARYVAEGVAVRVVTCTGGERGDVLNPALQHDPEVLADLPARRRAEMAEAARILGIEHHWLGFVDSGLPEGDPLPPLPEGCFALQELSVATAPLVAEMRSFRPHVVLTYDENGGYPHPDHIMTHRVSLAAFEAAGDPEAYPEAGEPWQPLKLYYDRSFSTEKLQALHTATLEAGLESPFAEWIDRRAAAAAEEPEIKASDAEGDDSGAGEESEDATAWVTRPPTTFVPCGDYFDVRDAALKAHATQIDPDGWFFSVPRDLQARVWPTEDYELARSHVPTQLPEDDLFAGLRERVPGRAGADLDG